MATMEKDLKDSVLFYKYHPADETEVAIVRLRVRGGQPKYLAEGQEDQCDHGTGGVPPSDRARQGAQPVRCALQRHKAPVEGGHPISRERQAARSRVEGALVHQGAGGVRPVHHRPVHGGNVRAPRDLRV